MPPETASIAPPVMAASMSREAQLQLSRMISGHFVAQMISVCARLGIADCLGDSSLTPAELADKLSLDAGSLERTLRALSTSGIFKKDQKGRYSLSEIGYFLRSDVRGSQAHMAATFADLCHWLPWGQAAASIRTGLPSAGESLGGSFWDYLARPENQDQLERFNEAMTRSSSNAAEHVVSAYDFSGHKNIIDIGGGQGLLLMRILAANPGSRGVLFDLPQGLESGKEQESELIGEIGDRMQKVSGSFLESAPVGGDLYLMKHIIHDWDDSRCKIILDNIHEAMSPDGRLLIIETILDRIDEGSELFAHWLDLNMMIVLGGRERTLAEYQALLAGSGFRFLELVATGGHSSIIVADRI
ncbi:MAG: methyltransferase [Candidatus Melainabacteria bacterium]|nr:methyltransferase [Candidatus Melainabacteria bacterium]